MKKIAFMLLCILISITGSAQKIIEKNIDYKGQDIQLDVQFASEIDVKTWGESTVYLKADIYTKDGKYLDLYKLEISESSNTIGIQEQTKKLFEAFYDEWNKNNPSKKRYYYTGDTYEFNYTLYVPKNANFKVSSINGGLKSEVIEGDFTADLINGDIEIKAYTGNLDLSTINGEIDLKIKNSRFVAETIHGHIYADEKLQLDVTDRYVGQKVEGSFQNAASRLKLNTINGNMYLRL